MAAGRWRMSIQRRRNQRAAAGKAGRAQVRSYRKTQWPAPPCTSAHPHDVGAYPGAIAWSDRARAVAALARTREMICNATSASRYTRINSIHQTLAAFVQQNAAAQAVHCVTERQFMFRVGENQAAAEADMAKCAVADQQ